MTRVPPSSQTPKRRSATPAVSATLLNRTIAALRKNGVNVTGAVYRPDGTVVLETPNGSSPIQNDEAFIHWERRHGKGA